MVNGCSEAIHCSVADAYRSLALAVFGTGARDKMHLAEMSVSASVADIAGAEDKSKRELAALVKRVRELDPARNRGQVLDLLSRTRVLRGSLASIRISIESNDHQPFSRCSGVIDPGNAIEAVTAHAGGGCRGGWSAECATG